MVTVKLPFFFFLTRVWCAYRAIWCRWFLLDNIAVTMMPMYGPVMWFLSFCTCCCTYRRSCTFPSCSFSALPLTCSHTCVRACAHWHEICIRSSPPHPCPLRVKRKEDKHIRTHRRIMPLSHTHMCKHVPAYTLHRFCKFDNREFPFPLLSKSRTTCTPEYFYRGQSTSPLSKFV